jgi:hypothetical protein
MRSISWAMAADAGPTGRRYEQSLDPRAAREAAIARPVESRLPPFLPSSVSSWIDRSVTGYAPRMSPPRQWTGRAIDAADPQITPPRESTKARPSCQNVACHTSLVPLPCSAS